MSDLSQPSAASNAPILLHAGQFVVIPDTGARVMVMGHELDRGTVTYRIAYPSGRRKADFS